MKKNVYKTPSVEVIDTVLATCVLNTGSSSIGGVETPVDYPELPTGGETTVADSRRKSLWDDPDEEEDF